MSLAVPSIIGNKNVLYPYPGGTVQWANLFNNLSPYIFDGGNAIAVDSEQNVYVAGFTGRILRTAFANNISGSTIYIQGTTQDLSAERPPFRYTGAILIKYTSDGNPQWCRFVDYSGNTNINNLSLSGEILFNNFREDIGVGLTIDPSNNDIFMCGYHYGNNIEFSNGNLSNIYIDVSNINNASTTFTQNSFIVKYNSLGNVQWGHIIIPQRAANITEPSIEYNCINYYNNNLYIGGRASVRSASNTGNAFFYTQNNINQIYNTSLSIKSNPLNAHLALLMSINSTSGNYNWHTYISNPVTTSSTDRIKSIITYNNYMYFAGTLNVSGGENTILYSSNGFNNPSFTLSYPSNRRNGNSILLGKYDLSGKVITAKYIDSAIETNYNQPDNINKIICDNSGNLIVTGNCRGYTLDLSDISYSRPDLTSTVIRMDEAMFIAIYDTSLNPIKGRIIDTYRASTTDNSFYLSDIGNSIAVDSRNNIYIAGVLTDSSNNTQTVQIDNAIIDRYNIGGRSYGALLQLNSDLSAQWGIAIDYSGMNYRYEEIRDIVIDKYDNIYITGYGPAFSANEISLLTTNALLFGRGINGTNVVKSMGNINGFNYDICGFSASHGFVAKYSPGYVNIIPEQDGEQIKLSYYHTKLNRNLLKYNLIDTATSNIDAFFSSKGFSDISYTIATQPANTKQYSIQLSNVKTNRKEIVTSRPFTYNPIPAIQLEESDIMTTTIQGASSLNGIAVDSKGYIYVCDISQHCVRRFNPTFNDTSGIVVAGIAGTGCTNGSDLTTLLNPIQIVIDASDNLYIMDSYYGSLNIRIIKWNMLDNTKNINILSAYYNDTSNKLESKYMCLTQNKEFIIFPYIYIASGLNTYFIKLIKYSTINYNLVEFYSVSAYTFFYDRVVKNNNNNFPYSIHNIKMLIINDNKVLYAFNQHYLIHIINTYNDLNTIYSTEYLGGTYNTYYSGIKYDNSIFNTNSIVQNPITNNDYSIIIPNNNILQTFVIRTQTVSDFFILPSNNKFNSITADASNNIYAIYNNNTLLIKPVSVQLWVDGLYNIEQQQIELQWGLIGSQSNSNIYYNVYKNNNLIFKNIKEQQIIQIENQNIINISNNYIIETINKYNGSRISKNITINIPSVAPQFVFSPNPITLKLNSHIQYNDFSFNLVPYSGTINTTGMIVTITLTNNTNQTTSTIPYTNLITFPYLLYNSQYDVTVDISNILVTSNNFINTPISMSNKIVLQPTGILSTPIIQTITPSLTSCRITLSGIDQKSLNDLSYLTFFNTTEILTQYIPIINGSNIYIDISNLTQGTTYTNVYLKTYYKGNNVINTLPFSFTIFRILTNTTPVLTLNNTTKIDLINFSLYNSSIDISTAYIDISFIHTPNFSASPSYIGDIYYSLDNNYTQGQYGTLSSSTPNRSGLLTKTSTYDNTNKNYIISIKQTLNVKQYFNTKTIYIIMFASRSNTNVQTTGTGITSFINNSTFI